MEHSPTHGSFRLFRVAGIDVFLHWTWFLVAFLQISLRPDEYERPVWKVVEYVSLFGIVLLHEFGHAFACRSVGGEANLIVLWPLGGIAYVMPPARPGPVLWSIAAGPLVNVALLLPSFFVWYYGAGWETSHPDLYLYVGVLARINLVLLIFNLLPIYPLDGGQIVHALLWFGMGRWQSLLVVSVIGLALGGVLFLLGMLLFLLGGASGVPGAALSGGMFALIAAFIALRSLAALQHSRAVLYLQALPRHQECACPTCHIGPPRGPFWVCDHCQTRFDLFDTRGQCPACGAWYLHPACPHCHNKEYIDRWFGAAADGREEGIQPEATDRGGVAETYPPGPTP